MALHRYANAYSHTHINNQTPHPPLNTHTLIQPSSHIKYLLKYEPPVAAFPNGSTITSLPHQWGYSSPLKHVFICVMMDSNDFL